MKRAVIAMTLLLAAGCGRDSKKPYFDAKQSFAESLTGITRLVPFARAAGAAGPPWYVELSGYARTRISQIATLGNQQYERETTRAPDAITPSSRVSVGLTAVAISCKPKLLMGPERTQRDTEAMAACEQALDRLDTILKDLDAEATKAGLAAGTIPTLGVEPSQPSASAEIAALKRLLEASPAEKKWQAVRDDEASLPDALKAACEDAAQDAARAADTAPGGVRDVYEARAAHAKGRKLLLMEADRFAALEAAELAAKPERDKLCARLRTVASAEELPRRYAAKLGELVKACP